MSGIIGALDEAAPDPLYRQLHRALREAIRDDRLAGALPPERDMASDLRVSRITVRKALDALAGEGLVERRQGAGTFVAPRVEKSFSVLSSFTEDMAARGRTVRSEWLRRTAGTVSPEEALALGLGPGSPVWRFDRLRFADEVPLAIEASVIAGQALPSSTAVDRSLYVALAAAGCRPVRALQRLRAILFDRAQAERLGVAPGAPGLLIERHGFLADGRPVEWTRSFYRGDSYDFVAELNGPAR